MGTEVRYSNGQVLWNGTAGFPIYHANGKEVWNGTPGFWVYHDTGVQAWNGTLGFEVKYANGQQAWNGSKNWPCYYPTGVEICHAMVHGGPYPATSDGQGTSVGSAAIFRFTRRVCFQNFPDAALPAELQKANPCGIWRLVDGTRQNEN